MTLAEFLDALNDKFITSYHFELVAGRKFTKVLQSPKLGTGRSVYAFVDADGNVYKAASYKAPAKGVRANLATLNMDNVDAYGSWLYAR